MKIFRTYFVLLALISVDLSAISLREFYLNNDSTPILPMGVSDIKGSSITVIYDQDSENMTGGKINLEVKEEYSRILESEEAVTISLKPGTYSLSVSNTSKKSDKETKSIQLKDGDHKLWTVKVLESHKKEPEIRVDISI